MSATIHLHVGMHKTGTTSIQATSFGNRRTLLRHGVNYLSLTENHGTVLYPLFSEQPHRYPTNVRAGVDVEEKAAQRNVVNEKAVRRELKRNQSPHVVMSGEALFNLPAAGLARLKHMLAPYADDVRILVYVRDPHGFINSAFQHRLRYGHDWQQLVASPPLPRYRRIRKFIEVFGADRVDVRVFDPAQLKGGDLLVDFFDAIGADPAVVKTLKPVKANESLSYEAVLILKALNRIYPNSHGDKRHPERADGVESILAMIQGRPFRLPRSVFAGLRAEIEPDLAWLHDFFGRQVFSFDPDAHDDPAPAWSEDAIDSLAVLINAMAKKKSRVARLMQRDEGAFGSPVEMLRLAFSRRL